MGAWYTVGVFVGLGVALGVALAATLPATRAGLGAALVFAAAGGLLVGVLVADWTEGGAGATGGILGALGGAQLSRGTLERGGTRAGTALFVTLGALALAALALVPLVGYVEAVVVPALAARLRRRGARTHAGLRILARD